MPAIQTTYLGTMLIGRPGQIANEVGPPHVLSKVVQTNALAFGAPVLRGTIDNGAMAIGTTGAGVFIGISVLAPEVRPFATADVYQPGDTAAVLTKGWICVTVTSAVTPGTAAYYDSSGNITATTTSNTAIPGGAFESTTASGGIALLRLS